MKKKTCAFLSLTCVAVAGCFVLSGCGNNDPKINKENYSTALSSVSTALKAENTGPRPVDYNMYEDEFIITTNKESLLVIAKIVDLASGICSDENFNFTTTPFTFKLNKIDGINDAVNKMQFGIKDDDLEFKLISTNDMNDMSYYEYFNITIDYNFEENALEQFSIKNFYKYSSGAVSYHYYEYENGLIKMLKPMGDTYYDSKDEAQLEAQEYIESKHVETDLNFTELYNNIVSAN